jgi:hypothetical protein
MAGGGGFREVDTYTVTYTVSYFRNVSVYINMLRAGTKYLKSAIPVKNEPDKQRIMKLRKR